MLSQLLYFSEVRDLGPGGVLRILEQAREGNAARGLTGALVFDQHYFLQCLEGSRESVTEIFTRIATDERHAHVTLMSMHDIDERDFSTWTMGYISCTPIVKATIQRFLPSDEFNPAILSSTSATSLMKSLGSVDHTV